MIYSHFEKINNQKKFRKLKKQWIIASTTALGLISVGTFSESSFESVHADTTSAATNIVKDSNASASDNYVANSTASSTANDNSIDSNSINDSKQSSVVVSANSSNETTSSFVSISQNSAKSSDNDTSSANSYVVDNSNNDENTYLEPTDSSEKSIDASFLRSDDDTSNPTYDPIFNLNHAPAGSIFDDLNNYIGKNPDNHTLDRSLTTVPFNINLTSDFKAGGNITISPDYSVPGSGSTDLSVKSTVPVIIDKLYVYNSVTKKSILIYGPDREADNVDGISVTKSGSEYNITVPKDDNISNYSIVFTINPLNSYEMYDDSSKYNADIYYGSNYYQHPSYGFYIKGVSNDGKINGSDYHEQNGGMGILWSRFDQNSDQGLFLKAYQYDLAVGSRYSNGSNSTDIQSTFNLEDQFTDQSKFSDINWVLRDVNGNTVNSNLKDDDINNLSKGTYYATAYGKINGLNSWNTIRLYVKDKGTVTSHYVDQDGKPLTSDVVQTGPAGDPYRTYSTDDEGNDVLKSFDGYTLKTINGHTLDDFNNSAAKGTYINGNIDVTYVYEQNVGTVTSHYVDQNGNTIASNDVQSGNRGNDYSTTPKTINGYTFSKSNGATNGKYIPGNIDVTYIYNKNSDNNVTVIKGTVTSHYVDQNGNMIAPDDVQNGNEGSSYTTTQKVINGYTFEKVDGNVTGAYVNGNINVTYVYNASVNNGGFNYPVSSSGNSSSTISDGYNYPVISASSSSSSASSASTPTSSSASSNSSSTSSVSSNTNKPHHHHKNNSVSLINKRIYNINTIYSYKKTTFKGDGRKEKFKRTKRTKRSMFKVVGTAKSQYSRQRYLVVKINPKTNRVMKRVNANMGYITANKNFVKSLYYKSVKPREKFRVITNLYEYRHHNLTEKVRLVRKDKKLTAKSINKQGSIYRIKLTNGHYVTANKRYVILDKY